MTFDLCREQSAQLEYLTELDEIGAGAVLCLRRWCDGPAGRDAVTHDFTQTLGDAAGREAVGCFETLCEICFQHGERPLICHQTGCGVLGKDELFFADFIVTASEGAHDVSMKIASGIVRPDFAPSLATLAEAFGLALRRMARGPHVYAPLKDLH
ncbi:hypothetical protein OEZ71_01280 [Defluviimonas sp. WL0050]|uniref:Uncharacterized protein n=1 Tax=Albidovulum litorale TaxID=2984134 RepID=A0ABT2ZIR5_9RHOB|nr:hypothetical protein [Defluviimonas sp. WL0050]MCV2870918.1 hypothetical protein [Defluviimonas sp. WL0050]